MLEPGGTVCASFRADNVQTKLTDWLADKRLPRPTRIRTRRALHKMNLTRREFSDLFSRAGFAVEYMGNVENMPILQIQDFSRGGHKVQ